MKIKPRLLAEFSAWVFESVDDEKNWIEFICVCGEILMARRWGYGQGNSNGDGSV